MPFFHNHILSIILFTPLAGMVVLLFIPGENKNAIRWWGNLVMFAGFLASLAFNVRVEESDIYLQGIDQLDAADIKFADELGYVVKLLAIAERKSGFGFRGSGIG